MIRWENPLSGRYYEVRVLRDLWGHWEILRTWGRIGTAHGGQQREQLACESACVAALAGIERRRRTRGYTPVS